jgi:hypothetical protein
MSEFSQKYAKTHDDHMYINALGMQLSVFPYCEPNVYEEWLEHFKWDLVWVQSDGVDYIESFPQDLLDVAPMKAVSTDFLNRAVRAYHEHDLKVCEAITFENCQMCQALLSKALSINPN